MEPGVVNGIETYGAFVLIGNIIAALFINRDGEFPRGTIVSLVVPTLLTIVVSYGILLGPYESAHVANIVGIWTAWFAYGGFLPVFQHGLIAVAVVIGYAIGILWGLGIVLWNFVTWMVPFDGGVGGVSSVPGSAEEDGDRERSGRSLVSRFSTRERVRLPVDRESDDGFRR